MNAELQERVAWSLDADPVLLPLLPELLEDLTDLGSTPRHVLDLIRSCGAERGFSGLDLGCGKGAASILLARELQADMTGYDAFPPFVAAAEAAARAAGVAHHCRFHEGDIVEVTGLVTEPVDVVLLLAVGTPFGDHPATLDALRRAVRPGGLMVVDDAFSELGIPSLPDLEATKRALTAHGDTIVAERVYTQEEVRNREATYARAIRARVDTLKVRFPDLAEALEAYAGAQEREAAVKDTGLFEAVWVLRREG